MGLGLGLGLRLGVGLELDTRGRGVRVRIRVREIGVVCTVDSNAGGDLDFCPVHHTETRKSAAYAIHATPRH